MIAPNNLSPDVVVAEGPEWGDEPVLLDPAPRRFQFLHLGQILGMDAPEFLLDGVLPDRGLAVLYGAPASFKSFVALDWAWCVAAGVPWFGRRVKERSVVYVAAEGIYGMQARVEALPVVRPGTYPAERLHFLGVPPNLLAGEDVDDLRAAMDDLPERPGLIVVDTMARTMVGGDEDRAKDVGVFVASVATLAVDALVLVVHHTGKDGKDERGSSALRGAADVMVKVERERRSPNLKLVCSKMKDAPEFDDVLLRAEQTERSLTLSERIDLTIAREVRADDLSERTFGWIAENGPAAKRVISAGVSGRNQTVQRLVDDLVSAGRVRETPDGFEAVPDGPEPPGNRLMAESDAGGSDPGVPPVGGPGREPLDPGGPVPVPAVEKPRSALRLADEVPAAAAGPREAIFDLDDDLDAGGASW